MHYKDVLTLIEVVGVLAFSMTGIFEARRLKMDIVGVYSLAMITAFGGGTVRDLFLQRHPLFWIQNWPYDAAILILSLISVLILKQIRSKHNKALVMVVTVFDALGVGLFSVLGAEYSLEVYPGNYFISVLMGVVTGCFGGVIRDIVGNQVPSVFKKSQLYATCSLAGCVMYVLLAWSGLPQVVSLSLSAGVVFAVRMLAVRYDVKLPV
ncbi:MAG TPA: trimeric intracellular cation channel family protein [Spirochaetia bacterium]|nr:trimeric intracellular cation channel family protein [Spirochaetia bacterium]